MMQYENKSSLFGYFCSEIALSKNPEIAAISFRIDKQFSAVHNRPSLATSAPCSSLKLLKYLNLSNGYQVWKSLRANLLSDKLVVAQD